MLLKKSLLRFFQSAGEKIDLSDRPTSRSRTQVKGKKTPENLVMEAVSDFFNSIGQFRTIELRLRTTAS